MFVKLSSLSDFILLNKDFSIVKSIIVFNYIIILDSVGLSVSAVMETERCKYASLKGRSTVQKIGRAKADFFRKWMEFMNISRACCA